MQTVNELIKHDIGARAHSELSTGLRTLAIRLIIEGKTSRSFVVNVWCGTLIGVKIQDTWNVALYQGDKLIQDWNGELTF